MDDDNNWDNREMEKIRQQRGLPPIPPETRKQMTIKTYIETGGPAFPCDENVFNEGITIRDYFASDAMKALLLADLKNGQAADSATVAKNAWRMANAMLAARNVPHS